MMFPLVLSLCLSQSLTEKIETLSAKADEQHVALKELKSFFKEQKKIAEYVPSIWPVSGFITSNFGSRLDPITRAPSNHAGMDIASDYGRDVLSPAVGLVTFVGWKNGYGNTIMILHGDVIETLYGHLSRTRVKVGQIVDRGEVIGNVGSSGRSTGPHLHYELRINGVVRNVRSFIVQEM